MKKFLNILFAVCFCIVAFGFQPSYIANAATNTVTAPAQVEYTVTPLDLVKNPAKYLNKRVCMTSKFSKYSTIGLDYKPAYKPAANYITFLFLREDVSHNIPLSELKMFIKRTSAEKLPDIKEGDTIKVTGVVFSNALGDVWLEADTVQVIKK